MSDSVIRITIKIRKENVIDSKRTKTLAQKFDTNEEDLPSLIRWVMSDNETNRPLQPICFIEH